MSTNAITPITATTLEQALAAIENAALTSTSTSPVTSTAAGTTSADGVSSPSQPDSTHFSPLGQLISTLQQLQKTDPAKYSHVTQQIATNLQSAAQTAQTQGNSSEAKQ